MEGPLLRFHVLFRAAFFLLAGAVCAGILPQALAIPNVPVHLVTDICNATNYEGNTHDGAGAFDYYTGIPDAYCQSRSVLALGITRFGVCGITGAPACSTAIAPFATKAEACKATTNTFSFNCPNSIKVFYNVYDVDCDIVVICEYFDGPVTSANVTNASTPGTSPAAVAPTAVLPSSPSLLPKAGDVVVLSAYATGAVQYTCNKASGLFANTSMVANLYTNPPRNGSVGMYVSANGTQVYSLADGGTAQIGPLDRGASYAQNPNVLLDGGYGSLNQSYSTATGNLSLANVTYIAITGTTGGVLPNKAVCTKATGTLALIPSFPWTVPYEANVTFYSKFTPPV